MDHHGLSLRESAPVSDIIEVIRKGSSFYNNDLLLKLIDCHCTNEDREKKSFYKQLFQSFVVNTDICSLPPNVYGNFHLCRETDYIEMIITVHHEQCKLADLQLLCSKFCEVFDIHPSALHVLYVENNRLSLYVQKSLYEQLLEIPSEKETLLEEVHIKNYTIHGTIIRVSIATTIATFLHF